MGAALGRIAKLNNSVGIGKQSRPYPPEVYVIASVNGHEKSLEGKQTSREGESHPQEANVAEADMVRHVMSNPRTPITIYTPRTAINWVWRRTGFNDCHTPCPATLHVWVRKRGR